MLFLLFALLDRWLVPPPAKGRCDWLIGSVYAHRGYHDRAAGRIENSPAAFGAAVVAGLGIECDVQASRDGQAMVFHDEDLARLTGQGGLIADATAAALSRTGLAGSTDTIPTLAMLLAQLGGCVPLLIEIKIARGRHVAPLCLAVRRALEGYGGPVAVMSFDARVGAWFHHYAPQVPRGLVMSEAGWRTLAANTRRHRALWRARPDFLAYDIDDVAGSFAQGQRRRGLPVLTWTVDTATRAGRARARADAPIAEGEGLTTILAGGAL